LFLLSSQDGLKGIGGIGVFWWFFCALVEDGVDIGIVDDVMMVSDQFDDAFVDDILHEVGQLLFRWPQL